MKKLTILVVSMASVGHVNSCIGATKKLLKRGHRVVFFFENEFANKAKVHGFEELTYESKHVETLDQNNNSNLNPGEKLAEALFQMKIIGPDTPEKKLEYLIMFHTNPKNLLHLLEFNSSVKEAIDDIKPDLIYYDGIADLPSIHQSGIPWIENVSFTPIFHMYEENLPPGGSGLPENDQTYWKQYRSKQKELHEQMKKKIGEQLKQIDPESVFLNYKKVEPILTVYAYPDELNYEPFKQKEGWFNLERFQRNDEKLMENSKKPLNELIPREFFTNTLNGQWSGKWIYITMGSMGSIDVELMKRLVKTLSTSNHKFIVSKGHRHQCYDLPSNMYGERYLPQIELLPHMDLVLTHGGNNTTTETFIEGKPMIVMPLFADQYDNAQRIHEKKFGLRLDPYRYKDEELHEAIDQLLNDTELLKRLKNASERIRSIDRHEQLVDKIESLII
ncbi:hypothetical protein RDWZM_006360 [Blomia tropicalis]|uniref:UDP-glycosyltransferase n=1 Tax=Blomia tropicalis TaxID=40697 RepID=A0A9Q0M5Z9_BLOTA|nr:UDP-glucuronosyltransferase 2A1 [Blomia tropicalis]KAJ6220548.1 hypothetical protein RDWZM_006360 [Blomia tropicalis]